MKNNDSNNHIIEIDGTFYQKVNKDVKAGKIVNGKRDDEWIEYHKNGEVASKTNYVNGVLHGESWGWFPLSESIDPKIAQGMTNRREVKDK